MKTLLLARPDHSTFLYEGLRKNPEIDIKYHTFSAFKKGSLLNRWKPSVKNVDSEVEISYSFTFFHRLLYELQKQINFDYYKTEKQFSEYFYDKILQKYDNEVNIIHYWSIYCHKSVKEFQRNNPKTKLLADVYAAHPDYVREILEPEFDKFGLSIETSHFLKSRDRDTASLEGVENMLVPSEYMAEIYQKYYPNTKIFTASYGLLNFNKIPVKSIERAFNEPLKLIFVGKISIEKGCVYLLEAIKQLPQTKFQLDLIGDIELNQMSIFQPYFRISNINFLGKLPNLKILEILPNYHIFVLPSLTDAYSLAVSEALTYKLPVIITENVGYKDEIRKFEIGEVCKVKSVEAILQAILTLQNEEFRQHLITNIDKFARENQQNSYSSKVLAIYNQLLTN
jgi:glycosyltransferase involved in cell wall biosynthesis